MLEQIPGIDAEYRGDNMPLIDYPDLVPELLFDVAKAKSYDDAAIFFNALTAEDKAFLWSQCPRYLRQRILRLKEQQPQEAAAA